MMLESPFVDVALKPMSLAAKVTVMSAWLATCDAVEGSPIATRLTTATRAATAAITVFFPGRRVRLDMDIAFHFDDYETSAATRGPLRSVGSRTCMTSRNRP